MGTLNLGALHRLPDSRHFGREEADRDLERQPLARWDDGWGDDNDGDEHSEWGELEDGDASFSSPPLSIGSDIPRSRLSLAGGAPATASSPRGSPSSPRRRPAPAPTSPGLMPRMKSEDWASVLGSPGISTPEKRGSPATADAGAAPPRRAAPPPPDWDDDW
mmetsp:Transcript_42484/g.106618  ORF Transcript_42484/g.106618 Transcript_42484/m.106618 type:complete len:162 (-) Transcript_42484:196-681(-)